MMSASSVVISREALLPALALAARVIERRNTIPVLGNVLLSTDGGRLSVRATDLDIQVTAAAPCTVAGPAVKTTLPAQSLHDIVRKLPEGCEITLSGDAREWTVAGARSRFRLPCLPAGDFPEFAELANTTTVTLPAETLRRMIDAVKFAICTEETRYYLNGIYLHRGEDRQLVAVTTDGHRLARMPMQLAEAPDLPGIIVPRKTVDQVARILPDKGEVRLAISDTRIGLELDGVSLVSKLIDGTYPDYQRVVPQGNGNRFLVERAALVAAVDRVTTMSSGGSRAVRFSFDDGEIRLAVSNPDAGSAEETVPAVLQDGQKVEIGFNGRYCLDVLAAAGGKNVVFELGDAGSPARIVPDGADAPSPYFVIMPMRV